MRLFNKILAGAVGSLMLASTGALAADIAPIVPPAPAPMIIPPPAPGFDWSGLYVGAMGGYTTGAQVWTAAGQVGYNFVNGNMLYGVEGRFGATNLGNGALFVASGNARVGFIAGDRTLIYAAAGIGYIPSVSAGFYTVGGGAEFAVGQNVSLFGEARYIHGFGGGNGTAQLNFGLNWHL